MAEREFRAGLLSRDRIIEVLSKRASGLDWGARLPEFPISLRQWMQEKPGPDSRSRTPRGWDADTKREFEELVTAGALQRVSGDRATACSGGLFFVDQTVGPKGGKTVGLKSVGVVKAGAVRRKLRLIYDCRTLNALMSIPPHFALDDIYATPAYLATKGARFLGKVDLMKAYFQIPIAERDRHLLTCTGPDGTLYEWTVLPMGLSHSPSFFQSLTECFRDAWRAAGALVLVYLDDFLVAGATVEAYASNVEMVVGDLLDAGWLLRDAKCEIDLSPSATYLGIDVHATDRTLSIPPAKVRQIVEQARVWADAESVPLKDLQSWIGRASFTRTVCPRVGFLLVHLYRLIPLPDRPPEWDRDHPTAPPHRLSFSLRTARDATPILLTPEAQEELRWWAQAESRLSRATPWSSLPEMRVWVKKSSLAPQKTSGAAASDASESGFAGSYVGGPDGNWSTEREVIITDLLPDWIRGTSSCAREVYGAAMTIRALPPSVVPGTAIRFVMDAQASIASATRGRACKGTVRAARLLDEAIEYRGLQVAFEWVPRELLALEDAGSREAIADGSNARAHVTDIRRLTIECGFPNVDLFASPANTICPRFGSRWGVAGSLGDGVALISRLSGSDVAWGFPPFSLARATLAAATVAWTSSAAHFILLLPDRPALRSMARAAGWSTSVGLRSVRYPDGSIRAPPTPVLVFRPPRRAVAPLPCVASPPPQRQ